MTKTKTLPTQAQLKELFDYSVITGLLYEKTRRHHKCSDVGEPVKDSLDSYGYRQVVIDGKRYRQQRLIWKWVTGQEPNGEVDHKDGDILNNSWHNLREASSLKNSANRGLKSTNTSGYKGVNWHKAHGKWEASITKAGKRYHLGRYSTAEQASDTYEKVASILHGSFYRPSKSN